jgi:serine protease
MSTAGLLHAIAKASAAGDAGGALPAQVIRFTLEYSSSPDAVAEHARLQELIGETLPPLVRLDEDLPEFLVLQFADVPRTISTPGLFSVADFLGRELGLRSCTPDVGVRGLEPAVADDLASESALGDSLMNLTCRTRNPDPEDRGWAARSVRAPQVWDRTKGAGILIAQPDTGVAAHPAIDPGLDMAHAHDVMTGQAGAADPLRTGSGNPGHGTATASVIIGRSTVQGIAPEAKVAPIRTIESVLVFEGAPIARAIMHAIRIQAHVITMSLGGLFISPALRAALDAAVRNDVIVCAAAGNCVQPIVVYPASDPNVHAIAGIGVSDEPWRGSSRGTKIAFSAPAEKVYVARRAPNDGGNPAVEPGEGTSFATAAAAGVAALWLAHHGRDNVVAEARGRGIPVHRLFLLAAVTCARGPVQGAWDRRYGAGIVDAERMIDMALADIPQTLPQMESAVDPALDEQTRALIEVMGLAAEPALDPGFDWSRFGPEAIYLAGDAWRRRQAEQAVFVESALKPEPGASLRAAGLPPTLQRALAPAGDEPLVQPPLLRPAEEAGQPRLRAAGLTILSPQEAGGAPPKLLSESTRRRVTAASPGELLDAAERQFRRRDEEDPEGREDRAWALESAARGLSGDLGGPDAHLPFEQVMALEALVRLTDRPAYAVRGGVISVDAALDPEWSGTLQLFDVAGFAASVGRIDLDGAHVGTGSVVAPGVIMTNRHVLEALAEEVSGPNGASWIFSRGDPSIDFSDIADGSKRFALTRVIAAGATPTSGLVRFTTLDMVLLEAESQNDAGLPLPSKLSLADASDVSGQIHDVVTMGYPARPSTASMRDPVTNLFRPDVMNRLQQIFGLNYGRKYLAPGRIDLIRGQPRGDTHKWVFAHEATTLGGNSGSPVAALAELAVHGLHFAGATLVGNYAHSLSAVKASGRLPQLGQIDARWV